MRLEIRYRPSTIAFSATSATLAYCLSEQRLQYLLCDRSGYGAAFALGPLDRDGDCHPRLVRRSEGDEPDLVLGGAWNLRGPGLARHGDALEAAGGAGAFLDHVLHHLADLRGRLCAHDVGGLLRAEGLLDATVLGDHALHELRLHPDAAIRDGGGYGGHLQRRREQVAFLADRDSPVVDAAAARPGGERAARHHLVLRVVHRGLPLEAEAAHVPEHRAPPQPLADLTEHGVDRMRQRVRERDRTEVLVAEVLQRHARDHLR